MIRGQRLGLSDACLCGPLAAQASAPGAATAWRRSREVGVEASVDVSNDEPWRNSMLWTVLVVLLILWILGFSFQVAGNLIHLLLVVALIVLVLQLVTGRRL